MCATHGRTGTTCAPPTTPPVRDEQGSAAPSRGWSRWPPDWRSVSPLPGQAAAGSASEDVRRITVDLVDQRAHLLRWLDAVIAQKQPVGVPPHGDFVASPSLAPGAVYGRVVFCGLFRAYTGAGNAPSCTSRPNMSGWAHSSAMRRPAMRTLGSIVGAGLLVVWARFGRGSVRRDPGGEHARGDQR